MVIFKVNLEQFSGQVIFFGTKGERGVPSVIASNDEKLVITSAIHGKQISITTKTLKRNTEYTITISQKPSSKENKVVLKQDLQS